MLRFDADFVWMTDSLVYPKDVMVVGLEGKNECDVTFMTR